MKSQKAALHKDGKVQQKKERRKLNVSVSTNVLAAGTPKQSNARARQRSGASLSSLGKLGERKGASFILGSPSGQRKSSDAQCLTLYIRFLPFLLFSVIFLLFSINWTVDWTICQSDDRDNMVQSTVQKFQDDDSKAGTGRTGVSFKLRNKSYGGDLFSTNIKNPEAGLVYKMRLQVLHDNARGGGGGGGGGKVDPAGFGGLGRAVLGGGGGGAGSAVAGDRFSGLRGGADYGDENSTMDDSHMSLDDDNNSQMTVSTLSGSDTKKRKIACSLATLASKPEKRNLLVEDGIMTALQRLGGEDSPEVRYYVALALENLSGGGAALRARLVADGAAALAVQLALRKPSKKASLCLARALVNLSAEAGLEARLAAEGAAAAATALAGASLRAAEHCLEALYNLTAVEKKYARMEEVGVAVLGLCHYALPRFLETKLLRVLVNLSLVRGLQMMLMEGGCMQLIHRVIYKEQDLEHHRLCAKALYNLTSNELARAKVTEDLPHLLIELLDSKDEETRLETTQTLARLAQAPPSRQTLIKDGVVDHLRQNLDKPSTDFLRTARLTAWALCRLGPCRASAPRLVRLRAPEALVALVRRTWGAPNEAGGGGDPEVCMAFVQFLHHAVRFLEPPVPGGTAAAVAARAPSDASGGGGGGADSARSLPGGQPAPLRLTPRGERGQGRAGGLAQLAAQGALRALLDVGRLNHPVISRWVALVLSALVKRPDCLRHLDPGEVAAALAEMVRLESRYVRARAVVTIWFLSERGLAEGDTLKMIEALVTVLEEAKKLGGASDPELTGNCIAVLSKLCRDRRLYQKLLELDGLMYVMHFSEDPGAGRATRLHCAALLCYLTTGEEFWRRMPLPDLVHTLEALGALEDAETQHRIALSLFQLSLEPAARGELLNQGTHEMLKRMSGRPNEWVRRGCAAALCNLAALPGAERRLMGAGGPPLPAAAAAAPGAAAAAAEQGEAGAAVPPPAAPSGGGGGGGDVSVVSVLLVLALVSGDTFRTRHICFKALFNLLSEPALHETLRREQLIWGAAELAELALAEEARGTGGGGGGRGGGGATARPARRRSSGGSGGTRGASFSSRRDSEDSVATAGEPWEHDEAGGEEEDGRIAFDVGVDEVHGIRLGTSRRQSLQRRKGGGGEGAAGPGGRRLRRDESRKCSVIQAHEVRAEAGEARELLHLTAIALCNLSANPAAPFRKEITSGGCRRAVLKLLAHRDPAVAKLGLKIVYNVVTSESRRRPLSAHQKKKPAVKLDELCLDFLPHATRLLQAADRENAELVLALLFLASQRPACHDLFLRTGVVRALDSDRLRRGRPALLCAKTLANLAHNEGVRQALCEAGAVGWLAQLRAAPAGLGGGGGGGGGPSSLAAEAAAVTAAALCSLSAHPANVRPMVRAGAAALLGRLLPPPPPGPGGGGGPPGGGGGGPPGGGDGGHLRLLRRCAASCLLNLSADAEVAADLVNQNVMQPLSALFHSPESFELSGRVLDEIRDKCSVAVANLTFGRINSKKLVSQGGTVLLSHLAMRAPVAPTPQPSAPGSARSRAGTPAAAAAAAGGGVATPPPLSARPPPPDPVGVPAAQRVAAALRNLLCSPGNVACAARAGALPALVRLSAHPDPRCRADAVAALRNVTHVRSARELLVASGAIAVLMRESDLFSPDEPAPGAAAAGGGSAQPSLAEELDLSSRLLCEIEAESWGNQRAGAGAPTRAPPLPRPAPDAALLPECRFAGELEAEPRTIEWFKLMVDDDECAIKPPELKATESISRLSDDGHEADGMGSSMSKELLTDMHSVPFERIDLTLPRFQRSSIFHEGVAVPKKGEEAPQPAAASPLLDDPADVAKLEALLDQPPRRTVDDEYVTQAAIKVRSRSLSRKASSATSDGASPSGDCRPNPYFPEIPGAASDNIPLGLPGSGRGAGAAPLAPPPPGADGVMMMGVEGAPPRVGSGGGTLPPVLRVSRTSPAVGTRKEAPLFMDKQTGMFSISDMKKKKVNSGSAARRRKKGPPPR